MRRISPIVGVVALAAAVNLCAGIWLSLQPERSLDLQRVADWAGAWASGVNPYQAADADVDYPPWALVLLWPLSVIRPEWRPALWVVVNLGLVAVLLRRLAGDLDEPAPARVWLALLLLSTACVRTLNQFSVLAFALALAGGRADLKVGPSRTSAGRAVWLGLSLMKPQIGGIVLVWTFLTRDWRRGVIALCVPAMLTVVFALRVHESPTAIVSDYARALMSVHGAADPFPGHTELRSWIQLVWPSYAGRFAVAVALAAVLLLPAVAAAARVSRWTPDARLELLALVGAVSLLSIRHLSYDFLLLLPALVAWRVPPFARRWRAAPRAWWFYGLAALLVIEVPGWARLLTAHGAPPTLGLLTESDRLVALGAWAILAWRVLTVTSRSRAGRRPAAVAE